MRRVQAKVLAGVLVGLLAAAIVLTVDQIFVSLGGGTGVNPLETIELKTYDWRLSATARPETARNDIALIEIDEYSLRNLQPNVGRWPWPRAIHAELLDYLARAPAKVIGYDVNFAEADTRRGFDFGAAVMTGEESDRALIKSVESAGSLILLADATYEAAEGKGAPFADQGFTLLGPGIVERPVVFPPFPALAAAGSGLGHNLSMIDSDGVLRHTVPFVRTGDRLLPSLGLAAAVRAAGIQPGDVSLQGEVLKVADREMPLEWRHVRSQTGNVSFLLSLVNYRGPAFLPDLKTRPYASYSFFDLLYSEEQILANVKPNVDPAVFRDKIVFVGVTASGLFDVFETPFASGRMPGIQVHAAVVDDVLSNRFMTRSGSGVRVAIVVVSGLLAGLVATLVPAWWATGVTVVLIATLGWVATHLFAGGYWLNLSQPVLVSAAALFGGVAYQYFVEGREKRKMERLFGQYVSRDVYAQLVANPELARLGGHRREMTVLFCDIRGFTTLSERGQPENVVQTLNEYFSRMVHLVFLHKGTLDKFVGDMVMALFGAPLSDPQHADHAVEAALDMVAELGKLNQKWQTEGRPELDIGIGINTGPMIAGNIGSEAIMSYTVIGDAVNLGSRLESLNKQYGTRIIISGATRQQLTRNYRFRPLGDVVVKGKTKPVAIFEVVGRADAAEVSSPDAAHHGSPIKKRGSHMRQSIVILVLLALARPAHAQIGDLGAALKKAQQALAMKQKIDDLTFSEEEERRLGEDVSLKIRQRFGVVQDAGVHKYVVLAGTVIAQQSQRPMLPWTFVVLDTDGVNAFASPGGYVHITRGALGLMANEAELAAVLGHEIAHVTRKHTINAIRKNNAVKLGSDQAGGRAALIAAAANAVYDNIIENAYDRGDELDADRVSMDLAQRAGYKPSTLGDFLNRLAERNNSRKERNGLFASHPETKERVTKIGQLAASAKAAALVEARYRTNIKYRPTDITSIAVVTEGSAGLSGSGGKEPAKKEEPKKGLGLGALTKTVAAEKQTAQVSASGGARGIGADRAAKGGSNPSPVKVSVSASEIDAFKKGIA